MAQQAHTLQKQITKTLRLGYLLFLPRGYGVKAKQKWPLILFLHGAGERGDDLELVKKHGIPRLVEQRDDFPFIAVSPQCPQNTWWADHFDALDTLLEDIISAYAVDTRRMYLTGLSMGGYGTWHYACLHPDRFAAIVPICGGGPTIFGFPERVRVLKDVPIWAFHVAKDPLVSVKESETLVNILQEIGGNVRFTVYPDAEHDSWTETYNNPALYEWLLGQRRGAVERAPSQAEP